VESVTIEEKEKEVKKEYRRLKKIFAGLSAEKMTAVNNLIENVAFMSVTLQELQRLIKERGAVEKYQNGANQWGYKPSSAIQVYNATMKTYNTSLKLLLNELPAGECKQSAKDELANFLLNKGGK